MDFWGRAARNCTLLTVSSDVITEEIRVTQTVLEGLYNVLKRYGT
jgi:hypothetical protein